jgi:hypothetical protein
MATAFNLGGLLGDNDMGEFFSPEQRQAIQQRGLLSAAAALLQAGAPSTTRIGLGQALGSALEAGQAGAERAQQSTLTQILTKQKLDEAKRAQELQGRIASILRPAATAGAMTAPGVMTPEEALAVPGMAAGPTAARAALIGQERPAAPAMSPTEMKAGQYRQLADVMAAAGKGEEAKRYMDIAENLAPTRQEVVGEPIQTATGWVQRTKTGGFIQLPKNFEPTIRVKPMGAPITVTDQTSNKEILVQQYDDGTFKPLEGFGPKRDVVLQNVDGKIVAIDKAAVAPGTTFGTGRDIRLVTVDGKTQVVDLGTVVPGTTFGTGISPVEQARLDMERERLGMERRRLGISEAEFARNAYERVETAQGIVYVPKRPGAPIIPVMDAAGKPLMGTGGGKPTEGELNAAGFAQRMEAASGIVTSLPPEAANTIAAGIRRDPDAQRYRQAADDWIRAKLRKESGAAIGVDEMEKEYQTYFPQLLDTPEVRLQKAEARRIATEAMKTSAGRSYQPYVPPAPPAPSSTPQTPGGAQRPSLADIFRRRIAPPASPSP